MSLLTAVSRDTAAASAEIDTLRLYVSFRSVVAKKKKSRNNEVCGIDEQPHKIPPRCIYSVRWTVEINTKIIFNAEGS